MAFQKTGYYYNQQIRNYILQFMAIFTDLQVMIGKSATDNDFQLISVPIHYGHQDRVVAAILADNTQNTPIRLPTMSAYMRGFAIAENRMKGTGTERRTAYVPTGGLVPDDIKVIHQRMPVPYDLTMELSLYASNTEQHLQMLEQILILFDPQLQFQTDDAPFNWTRLSHVKIQDITLETNFPIGTDRRIIQSTIVFEMPIWLDTPADVRRDFVAQVLMRVGVINFESKNSYDILAELDNQGAVYNVIATDETLPFE